MAGLIPVLAVDDSAATRALIDAELSARTYRVRVAVDGREALTYLRAATEPHVVLLDIVMPVLDGLALLAEVKRDESLRTAGHRFILMSSTVRLTRPDIPAGLGQLVKPFTRQELVAAVEAALVSLEI